jgi:hypothetical protein
MGMVKNIGILITVIGVTKITVTTTKKRFNKKTLRNLTLFYLLKFSHYMSEGVGANSKVQSDAPSNLYLIGAFFFISDLISLNAAIKSYTSS